MEPSRMERNETSYLPVLPDGCYVSNGGEADWERGKQEYKEEKEEENKEEEGERGGGERVDLLFVTRVCVNPFSVSLLCPSVSSVYV